MPRMVSVRGSSRAKYLAAIAGLAVMATPAAAQIKADAVRIGVLTDMAGIFASAMGPGSVEAANMAAEEFGNKINGKHRLHGSGSCAMVCMRSPTAALPLHRSLCRNSYGRPTGYFLSRGPAPLS